MKRPLDKPFILENRNDRRLKDQAIVKTSPYYPLGEIAQHLGVHDTTVSRALKRTENLAREM
jgi:IS30 family transposase